MRRARFLVVAWLLSLPVFANLADAETYDVEVAGLACPFCAYGIERHLMGVEGVERVETDIKGGRVVVTTEGDATLSVEQVEAAVKAAGFSLEDFRQHTDEPAE